MRRWKALARTVCTGVVALASTAAQATYWNLFNAEGETDLSAQYVTYATLADMTADTNRLGIFTPDHYGAGTNIVDGGSDGATYWSLFNAEGETELSAQFVTYATLDDMLGDTNRLGIFTPDHYGAGTNIVGSGTDGKTYWNLFNAEGETDLSAQYVTYASLNDMVTDTNRLGIFTPDHYGAGTNIVDGGSDGSTYWSLFNAEGETALSAQYVTYSSLTDMLSDTNRLAILTPNHYGAGSNIVGSGTDSFPAGTTVPEPASWALLTIGFGIVGSRLRRRAVGLRTHRNLLS